MESNLLGRFRRRVNDGLRDYRPGTVVRINGFMLLICRLII
jgi:hypothetical protein